MWWQAAERFARVVRDTLVTDLAHDMRMACLHLMRAHGVGPPYTPVTLSGVQVVTPFNVPA